MRITEIYPEQPVPEDEFLTRDQAEADPTVDIDEEAEEPTLDEEWEN
jgi:hypothetical protein